MERGKFIDLVICGPDLSGTTTQINDLIEYFKINGKIVRDIRGTEMDAIFHAEKFSKNNSNYTNLKEFLDNKSVLIKTKKDFVYKMVQDLQELKIAACIDDKIFSYINPNSASVWVMEEPTHRGAGQVNRRIEQYRTHFEDELNPLSASFAHQAYRTDEFLRFRKEFRKNSKIILRSRSEESACYQIYDKNFLKNGISEEEYLNLPGHKIAFSFPPTHLFVVCGNKNLTKEEYKELRELRGDGRIIDDYEKNLEYQILVNKRYATDWLENLYGKGCKKWGGKKPKITRFNIFDSKEEIKKQMITNTKKILSKNSF